MVMRYIALILLMFSTFTADVSVASNRCDGDPKPPDRGECTGR